ncbi:MAG: Ku protein [Candidatus Obscuribacterales bacterium]|nr:Ku protein [Candidatus Obscuribacterales bacterium]
MAARAIWSGIITFGMVSIPVKLYSATDNKDISFNQLHRDCKGRVKEQRMCPTCDRKIEYEEIEKGYEYAKGQYVVLTKEDLEKLPLPNKNAIEITSFIDNTEIDPVFYDKAYYLEPDEAARKPFALFMRAMMDKGVVAVAKVTIRTKERLCCLRTYGGTMMMNTLLYPDEVRVEANKPLPDVQVSDKELAMASSLIDLMAQEFTPTTYKDSYREALLQLIEAKLEGKEIHEAPATAQTNVVDLMEALQASMESIKAKKSAPAEAAKMAEEPVAVVADGAKKTRKRKTG